jgi:hypothetical protein
MGARVRRRAVRKDHHAGAGRKLEDASEKEMGEFLLPHLETINQTCEKPGRYIGNESG